MSWTAILPMKLGDNRKSRLSDRLSPHQRAALSDAMAAHVLDCLQRSPLIARCIVLAPRAVEGVDWREDRGRGLNEELEAVRAEVGASVMVVFGDLPLLNVDDVAALAAAAEVAGVALGPDRLREGTNAVAIARGDAFRFRFGANSFALHRTEAPGAAIVERAGLSHDIDTPADLDAAIAHGFRWSGTI